MKNAEKVHHKRPNARAKMNERRAKVGKLYAVFGFTIAEIADQLNMSVKTISQDVTAVKKALKETYKSKGYADDVITGANKRIEEMVQGMVRESAVIKGKDGVMARGTTIRGITDQIDLLQSLGAVEKVADSVNVTGGMGTILEQGLEMVRKEMAEKRKGRKNKSVGTVKIRDKMKAGNRDDKEAKVAKAQKAGLID